MSGKAGFIGEESSRQKNPGGKKDSSVSANLKGTGGAQAMVWLVRQAHTTVRWILSLF